MTKQIDIGLKRQYTSIFLLNGHRIKTLLMTYFYSQCISQSSPEKVLFVGAVINIETNN